MTHIETVRQLNEGPAQNYLVYEQHSIFSSVVLLLPWNVDFLMLQVFLCSGKMLGIVANGWPFPLFFILSHCFSWYSFVTGHTFSQCSERHKAASHTVKRSLSNIWHFLNTRALRHEYIHWKIKIQYCYSKGSKM